MSIRQGLARTCRTLRARLQLVVGRVWLCLGRTERARRAFCDVLLCMGEDFDASFCLGRIAALEGDLSAAARELNAARLASPERFARRRRDWLESELEVPTPASRHELDEVPPVCGGAVLWSVVPGHEASDAPVAANPTPAGDASCAADAGGPTKVEASFDASDEDCDAQFDGFWSSRHAAAGHDDFDIVEEFDGLEGLELDYVAELRAERDGFDEHDEHDGHDELDELDELDDCDESEERAGPPTRGAGGDSNGAGLEDDFGIDWDSEELDGLFGDEVGEAGARDHLSEAHAQGLSNRAKEPASGYTVEPPLAGFYEELLRGGEEPDDPGQPFGDFTTEAEALRFLELPPIDPGEIRRVDWGELGEKLSGEDSGSES